MYINWISRNWRFRKKNSSIQYTELGDNCSYGLWNFENTVVVQMEVVEGFDTELGSLYDTTQAAALDLAGLYRLL